MTVLTRDTRAAKPGSIKDDCGWVDNMQKKKFNAWFFLIIIQQRWLLMYYVI